MSESSPVNGKRWYTVTLDVLLPDQKEHTLLRNMVHAHTEGEASRIGIRQVLASRKIEALFSSRAA